MTVSKTEKPTSTVRDMTKGGILRQLILFSLPLMLGNVFQMLYNTVDSVIVGNFVSKQALAAIGSTTMIVNMAVFFFNGFSVGAAVTSERGRWRSSIAPLRRRWRQPFCSALSFPWSVCCW